MSYYLYHCFSFVLGEKNERSVKLKKNNKNNSNPWSEITLVDLHTYTGDLNGRAHIL